MSSPGAAPTRAFVVSHMLGCSLFWASGFLFMKLSGDLSPFIVAAWRGAVAAISLALCFAVLGMSVLPRPEERRHWLFLGTFNGWGPNVLVAYALSQITTASAAMIQASSPLIVATIAHFMFAEERMSRMRVAGVLTGFVGMGILIGPAALPESGVSLSGALVMLAVAASYATGNIYARAIKDAEPARLALGQQVVSGIAATLLAAVVVGPQAFAPQRESLLPLIALGTLGTAIPILLFMRLIRGAGPTRASMVGYLVPVWAAIMATLFLGESVGLREILGGLVVLVGVALVGLTGRLRR